MDATHGRERGFGPLRLLWPSFAEASEGRPAFRSAADWCSRGILPRWARTDSVLRSSGIASRDSVSGRTAGATRPSYTKPAERAWR